MRFTKLDHDLRSLPIKPLQWETMMAGCARREPSLPRPFLRRHEHNSHAVFVVPPALERPVVQNRARVVLSTGNVGRSPIRPQVDERQIRPHVVGRKPSGNCVSETELVVR